MKLIYRAFKTPDGTLIMAFYPGDYMTYSDANGKTYTVEFDNEPDIKEGLKNMSIYREDPIEKIREILPCSYIDEEDILQSNFLKNLPEEEVQDLIRNEVNDDFKNIYKQEIDFRKNGRLN